MPANLPRSYISYLLEVRNGQLTLLSPGPGGSSGDAPLLSDCRAVAEMSDGTQYTTLGEFTVVEEKAGGTCLRTPGTALRPELRWQVVAEQDAEAIIAHLWLEVENTTDRSLHVERLDVLVALTGFRRVPAADLEVAQTGWQSWSYATPPVPLADRPSGGPPPVFCPMLPPGDDERVLVPWVTVLQAPSAGTMLAGFTTARDQTGILSIQPTHAGHQCVASTYIEGVPLAPGETRRSETLLLIFHRPYAEALEQYARELGANMAARKWPYVPTGWCSWYHFFTEVTEADILSNLEHLDRERDRIPLEYVQIDDGYQAEVGDWLITNDKFPNGMRFLAERIKERGFKPGIWLAPFIVHERSRVCAEHPDWLLRDDLGEPLEAMLNWGGRNFALDTTHPQVEKWLRQVIDTMVQEWGYEYLKIDFIYAAALRGKRHDPAYTSVQAYRRGLEIIREAAQGCFVLGCGAPFAPSVGLVDGMRVGPDVAPYWLGTRTDYGLAVGLHRAVRSTLARLWTHDHLWVSDPDCLMVRKRSSELTLAEVRAWMSLVALSGGMVLLSDDMEQLVGEPERAALVTRALPPSGQAAQALGPTTVGGIASRCQLSVRRPWEHWLVAALFNWTEAPQPMAFDPTGWDMPGVPYHLYDLWSGEHWGPVSGPVELGLTPQHGARLLSVHADRVRPQIVGSTLHVLGGPVELNGESWSNNHLTLQMACPGEREGRVVIYSPPGFTYVGVAASGAREEPIVQQSGRLVTLDLHFTDRAQLTLRFEGEEGTA